MGCRGEGNMSSLIGHSLVGWTVGRSLPQFKRARSRLLWHSSLIVAAIAPDFDYLIPWLRRDGLRRTHSVSFALLVPLLASLCVVGHIRSQRIRAAGFLVLTGLSHLLLDLLVGVSALPLLWPLSEARFKLPFGLLPSAGKPSLTNIYLYQNLLIELGVLVPLSASLWVWQSGWRRRWIVIAGLLAVSAYFMHWAYGLSR